MTPIGDVRLVDIFSFRPINVLINQDQANFPVRLFTIWIIFTAVV